MTARIITPETVTEFQDSLLRLERSPHTIGRYMHDVKSYYEFRPRGRFFASLCAIKRKGGEVKKISPPLMCHETTDPAQKNRPRGQVFRIFCDQRR